MYLVWATDNIIKPYAAMHRISISRMYGYAC